MKIKIRWSKYLHGNTPVWVLETATKHPIGLAEIGPSPNRPGRFYCRRGRDHFNDSYRSLKIARAAAEQYFCQTTFSVS